MLSAISFGVFCLEAPSTREIILSKKDSPGVAVISIFSQSLTTFVPPVTDAKSPPRSFITGADSPVIADSSTEAIPSITSPSFGIISPFSTKTISPLFNSFAFIILVVPSEFKSFATVSFSFSLNFQLELFLFLLLLLQQNLQKVLL